MGIVSERLNDTDKVLKNTLEETRQLIKEAKEIHAKTTLQIRELSNKETLTEDEKRIYAELITARQEAERAYYLLNDLIRDYDGAENSQNN
jgi:DNA-binding transcriptional regulator GbsR (MarR family)